MVILDTRVIFSVTQAVNGSTTVLAGSLCKRSTAMLSGRLFQELRVYNGLPRYPGDFSRNLGCKWVLEVLVGSLFKRSTAMLPRRLLQEIRL